MLQENTFIKFFPVKDGSKPKPEEMQRKMSSVSNSARSDVCTKLKQWAN